MATHRAGLGAEFAVTDPACPQDCAPGARCVHCMNEIRQEALDWIRGLNAVPSGRPVLILSLPDLTASRGG